MLSYTRCSFFANSLGKKSGHKSNSNTSNPSRLHLVKRGGHLCFCNTSKSTAVALSLDTLERIGCCMHHLSGRDTNVRFKLCTIYRHAQSSTGGCEAINASL